jgi:hypothetical protein
MIDGGRARRSARAVSGNKNLGMEQKETKVTKLFVFFVPFCSNFFGAHGLARPAMFGGIHSLKISVYSRTIVVYIGCSVADRTF